MSDITFETVGQAGIISLTRPRVINALSHEMILAVCRQLEIWREDNKIKMILIEGEGEKGFCAGGDIVQLYKRASAGKKAHALSLLADEYKLNAALSSFPKPIVSWMHGLVMGGGVGISAHGSHRLICQSTILSMPEVLIGIIPDVGTGKILKNAPGKTGSYLAVSAARITGGDILYAGFADMMIDQTQWPSIREELFKGADLSFLNQMSLEAEATIPSIQSSIDRIFSTERLEDVFKHLRAEDTAWAHETLERMERASPLAMQTALLHLEMLPENCSIEEALTAEYRSMHHAIERGDLLEGIRALAIDKDKTPKWRFDFGDNGIFNVARSFLDPVDPEWQP